MKTIILVLTKGPHRKRFGPRQWWDWIASCLRAMQVQGHYPDGIIYVPSAVKIAGQPSEFEQYAAVFMQLRLVPREESTSDRLVLAHQLGKVVAVLERKGQETVEQIGLACAFAEREQARLIVISTPAHFLRALYLCRGKNVEHQIAWGIPNPIEACADLVLAILFPVLDLFGLASRFQRWAIKRRASGKHF